MLLMRREYETAMVVVTHNIGVVEKMADQVLVLKNGEVREYGKTAQVLTAPDRSLYKRTYAFGTSPETCRHRKWRQMMAETKNPGSAESEKEHLLSGKKSFTAVEDVSFFLNAGEVLRYRGRIRFRKKYSGKNDHASDGYSQMERFFSWEKDITHAKGKSSPGNLTGNFRWFFRHRQNPLTPDALLGTESGKVSGIWG